MEPCLAYYLALQVIRQELEQPGCMNDYFDNWTIQLRKGLLEIGILSALKGRERYGYDLVKSLVKSPAWASPKARSTPCSPPKARLIDARLVEFSEGPARKYYTLTPKDSVSWKPWKRIWMSCSKEYTLKEKDA